MDAGVEKAPDLSVIRPEANVLAQREKPGRITATLLTRMSCPAGSGAS